MKCTARDAELSERHVVLSRVCEENRNDRAVAVCSCPACGVTSEIQPRADELRAWAILAKGTALQAQARFQEALGCCDHLLSVNPQSAMAWYNKGCILGNLRRFPEAVECYDRAVAVDPQYAEAWHNKACALRGLGRAQEALGGSRHGWGSRPPSSWRLMPSNPKRR